jgi:hypothetical protein
VRTLGLLAVAGGILQRPSCRVGWLLPLIDQAAGTSHPTGPVRTDAVSLTEPDRAHPHQINVENAVAAAKQLCYAIWQATQEIDAQAKEARTSAKGTP